MSALLELLSTATAADRREAERALAAALRRSPASRGGNVVSAYQSASSPEVRASLLQVMGQSGRKEALTILQSALGDSNADLVRAAILGLTEWPDDQPIQNLLAFSAKSQNPAHQILALRGFLKLVELPSQRSNEESVRLLATAMKLARQPEEKKAVLAQLPRFPTPEAMQLADAARADPDVASEAKIAVWRLKQAQQSK